MNDTRDFTRIMLAAGDRARRIRNILARYSVLGELAPDDFCVIRAGDVSCDIAHDDGFWAHAPAGGDAPGSLQRSPADPARVGV